MRSTCLFHKAPINRFSSCRNPSNGDAKAREKLVHNDFVLEVWTSSNWNQRWSISDNSCEKAQLQGGNYTDQKADMDIFLPSFLLSIHPSILFDDSFSDMLGLSFLWHIQVEMTNSYKTATTALGEGLSNSAVRSKLESLLLTEPHYPHFLEKGTETHRG